MKKYEGMFIFPPVGDDQQLEEKVEKARVEITKAGGTIESTTRMGRIAFAREMKKKESGVYVLVTFNLDRTKVAALRERLKRLDDIVRVQITLAGKPVPVVTKPVEVTAEVK